MAQLLLANPRKRRRTTSKKRKSPARRRRATSVTTRTTTRRYRRNPVGVGGIAGKFVDAGIGAAGALATDVAMKKLPFIPANLTEGPMGAATKGLVALGIGMLVAKVGKKRKLGEQLAAGGMTVAMYEVGKEMVGPSIGLSDYGGDLLGYDAGMGYYSDDMNDDWEDEGMGYYGNADTFDVAEDF